MSSSLVGSAVEREAWIWIEEMTGCNLNEGTFADSLKDGIILCKLANKIKPGSVPKINIPAVMPFKKMENIANYLKAVRSIGMKEFEMFGTPDLFEEKNVNQVINSMHALGRTLQTIMPDSNFPKLGIKVVEKNERHFSEQQLREAANAVSVMSLGSSNLAKKAALDVLAGRAALTDELGGPTKGEQEARATPVKAPARAAGGLPAGWTAGTTAEGYTYYLNDYTGESTWDKPTAPATGGGGGGAGAAASNGGVPAGWTEKRTDEGYTYYMNNATGESVWEKPTAPAAGAGGSGLPPGWTEQKTPEGYTYYLAPDGTSSWEKPTA